MPNSQKTGTPFMVLPFNGFRDIKGRFSACERLARVDYDVDAHSHALTSFPLGQRREIGNKFFTSC
jgi:hypothetical protein